MKKFGRSMEHRKMLMRGLVTNLIIAESIKTTLPKAKQARKDAEKAVTIAKKGTLAARRLAASRLTEPKAVQKLFDKIAPAMAGRNGGYTRIVKLGTRKGGAAGRWAARRGSGGGGGPPPPLPPPPKSLRRR